MVAVENVAFVFVAGLLTALATGLGAVPFFLVEEFSDRWNVVLWGLASGIMVAASLFGGELTTDRLGLGLLIIERVVSGHGWEGRVEVDGGTRFLFSGVSAVPDGLNREHALS